MIIIGIDPGTAKTGYAIVEVIDGKEIPVIKEVDCIVTPAGKDMHKRLKQIFDELHVIVDEHSPDCMVVERLFFNTNAKTAMTVGQARGIPLLVAARNKMEVFEYTALEAKAVLTGYGRASKKEMQEAVKEYMGLSEIIKPDDANDALAMAICFLNKSSKSDKSKSK